MKIKCRFAHSHNGWYYFDVEDTRGFYLTRIRISEFWGK